MRCLFSAPAALGHVSPTVVPKNTFAALQLLGGRVPRAAGRTVLAAAVAAKRQTVGAHLRAAVGAIRRPHAAPARRLFADAARRAGLPAYRLADVTLSMRPPIVTVDAVGRRALLAGGLTAAAARGQGLPLGRRTCHARLLRVVHRRLRYYHPPRLQTWQHSKSPVLPITWCTGGRSRGPKANISRSCCNPPGPGGPAGTWRWQRTAARPRRAKR